MRRRVNWYKVMCRINDTEIYDRFFKMFSKLRRGRSMSANRCAYNVLKSYYSTTTIAQLCTILENYL